MSCLLFFIKFITLFSFGFFALGNEQIIVTAEKIERPRLNSPSSTSVITALDLEKKKGESISSILQQVSGVSVSQGGSNKTLSSLFIRGSSSYHSLFLIDGIEMNNSITPNRQFDLSHISSSNIERIEILRGSQGVLYGPDAIGGVIHIITKKSKSSAPKLSLDLGYGSYQNVLSRASLSGRYKKICYVTGLEYSRGSGFSSLKTKDSTEDDGFNSASFNTLFTINLTKLTSIELSTRLIKDFVELDDFWSQIDDPNYQSKKYELYSKLSIKSFLFDGLIEPILTITQNMHKTDTINKPDERSNLSSSFESDSKQLKLSLQNNFYIDPDNTATAGLEFEKESGELESITTTSSSILNNSSIDNFAFYFHYNYSYKNNFLLSAGSRFDHHQSFGDHLTFKLAPGYRLNKISTFFHGSLSTGFKSPTIYQLYSSFGNQALRPEKSLNAEVGFESKLFDNTTLGVTYFNNAIEQMIDTQGVYPDIKYKNIDEVTISGIEDFLEIDVTPKLSCRVAHTYLHHKSDNSGYQLINRPKHNLNTSFMFNNLDKFNATISLFYKGDRISGSTFSPHKLPSYTLLNLNASYQLSKRFRLWGYIHNLLNKNYEDISGYNTAGVNFFVGLTWM
ncbi:MAG: TonB-dependent receptor [Bacteriovoracaceae bacterium]|nr:TonB-dependent receptor [Bacteriovoracaceae bacterium]